MRTGPGKHLKGLTLMGGIVKPEEVKVLFMLQEHPTYLEFVTSSTISMRWVHRGWSGENVFTFCDAYSSSFIKRLRAVVLEVTEMVIIHSIHLLQMLNPSLIAGLQAGAIIGLPPVLNFGSQELKARVIPEVLSGKKFICLAISEAFAGSDVMGLKTTAKKTADGKHWIVNGTKKWITNGQYVEALYCYRGTS
jgi:hypothetical protein